ncbi:apotyrosinase chaperone MelC1 [Streptomyces sp. NPDC002073]|uniref:apotyrosinase chaperone MelC1 n=1 Tax=Streptomyces sp. NBC_00239 TaxID=2903640 RepID=UPI002E2B4E22|nr:tyrosinase family oxidase copper chaperone [Streptomyces sp. NBC_00239]
MPPQLTRRRALMAGAGALATASLVGVTRALAVADPAAAPAVGTVGQAPGDTAARGAGEGFDEVFRGRRIQGEPPAAAPASRDGHDTGRASGDSRPSDHSGHGSGGWTVRIDGRDLHVMENADGSWVSLVNHYETFASPLEAARAAVIDLKGAQLLVVPAGGAR